MPGDIVDLAGRVLGRHSGIGRYTVGQRKGLGLGGGEPLYVLRIEPEHRRIVVGPRTALAQTQLALAEFNWLTRPAARMAVTAKLRSTADPCARNSSAWRW